MYMYIVLIIVAIIAINLYPKLFNIDFYEDTQQQQPPLVGGNPCTWGPSYWCASEKNATDCGLDFNKDCAKYNMTPQG